METQEITVTVKTKKTRERNTLATNAHERRSLHDPKEKTCFSVGESRGIPEIIPKSTIRARIRHGAKLGNRTLSAVIENPPSSAPLEVLQDSHEIEEAPKI